MAERFAKVNKQEIGELLDNNTKNTVFVYIINKFTLLVGYEITYDETISSVVTAV